MINFNYYSLNMISDFVLGGKNANIMVKNIHFFATLVNHVAKELGVEVGEYTVSIVDAFFNAKS